MKAMKQYQIADTVGVSGSFISQLIAGKKRPSWLTAKKLAKATNTDPSFWMEGSPDAMRSVLRSVHVVGENAAL